MGLPLGAQWASLSTLNDLLWSVSGSACGLSIGLSLDPQLSLGPQCATLWALNEPHFELSLVHPLGSQRVSLRALKRASLRALNGLFPWDPTGQIFPKGKFGILSLDFATRRGQPIF